MAVTALKPRSASPRAPAPAPPVRQYSFTDWQVSNPAGPPPGDRLDGEYDRSNQAISDTIAWASTSLNTDGSLKPQMVGREQLVPGLFDHIADAAIAEVKDDRESTENAARQALSAAAEADASALAAGAQNARAQAGARTADADAQNAAASAAEAAQSALEADASATDAQNSANHADLAEATCVDYGVLTQAWAEHMPDTIPPNILAVMNVTGDHWSSRWWANQAHLIVQNETSEAICDLQKYWLGAYAAPPTQNSCGDPVVAGSMYYNTTQKVCQVYDGALWHDVTQLAPGKGQEYLYLPATPTTVFTGSDYHGNILTLDTVNSQISVYLNGVRLLPGIDYSFTATSVTMLLGPVTTPNSVEIIALKDVTAQPPPSGVKVNTAPWVFNGITTTFPLADSGGVTLNPPGAVDCIVSLNGVIQEAGGDFTINPGTITFTVPPETDADRWMVVGIPVGAGQSDPWTPYTPTVTATTGAFTTVSATGRYKILGKTVYLQQAVTITTNGTAAGFIRATLPAGLTPAAGYVLFGAINTTQISLNAVIGSGLAYAQIARYDGTYPGADGRVLTLSGTFEAV